MHVPIADMEKSISAQVVFPRVFRVAEFTVNVAVPHERDGVKDAQEVPESPVPPLATLSAFVMDSVL